MCIRDSSALVVEQAARAKAASVADSASMSHMRNVFIFLLRGIRFGVTYIQTITFSFAWMKEKTADVP